MCRENTRNFASFGLSRRRLGGTLGNRPRTCPMGGRGVALLCFALLGLGFCGGIRSVPGAGVGAL
ncbi:hypothetical protein BofuT4_uP108180.1 [Botrytis cinerea T4]|uniref:Uncharacterized protein n=1 Tax=Botryotinia fuckeliana (strain T4) TaxID=999810 RepID=G2Y732_BOTF4|nr:hypothetical protein BofuT4_uP108180.1 [Botrytis cinerea T4]